MCVGILATHCFFIQQLPFMHHICVCICQTKAMHLSHYTLYMEFVTDAQIFLCKLDGVGPVDNRPSTK